jgi:hypothetical protein
MTASATEAVASGGEIQPAAADPLAHPEEIKATVDLRLGNRVQLKATARTTPAGLVAAGLMVSSILVAAAFVVRAAGGQRDRRHT